MKRIYTTVFLCLTSFSFAQSLSFPEALERMRGANQKLKGMKSKQRRLIMEKRTIKACTCPN